ncbi:MAG: ABC transporter permease [Burkholderiaceae bacterium]
MTPPRSPAWRCGRAAALAVFAGVFVLPLAAGLALALREGSHADAWAAMWADPQFAPAWAASVRIAVGSTFMALVIATALTAQLHGTRLWRRVDAALAPMLAVPHAAFAIGCALLVMPSGLLARVLAPWLGWSQPPDWRTVHDEAGLAMIAVLVLKELPFLLWNIAALLARPELAEQLQRHRLQAQTFGWRPARLWWRVWWPWLLPRLAWPVLAVLAYSLSVVDVALVVGPLAPPPLAVLAWQALLDGDPATQAVGAAQVISLTITLAVLALLGAAGAMLWRRLALRAATRGPGQRGAASAGVGTIGARGLVAIVAAVYVAAIALLVFAAGAGPWPFPQLAPRAWDALGWWHAMSPGTLAFSAALAGGASALALVLGVAWLECVSVRSDTALAPLLLVPLAVPPLLLMVGLYQGALALRLDGSVWGLLWVHVIVVLPYTLIVLAPAWRSFDARYETTARSLGRGAPAFWWHAKWPMLRAPIAAALAVGFAVALAQYLPTLFIGAGRFATVTTEAVTLAAGGQRQSAAVYALWQAVLPLAAFALALRARREA